MDDQEKLLYNMEESFLFNLLIFKEDFLTPKMTFEKKKVERNPSGLNPEALSTTAKRGHFFPDNVLTPFII